jgi:negative regulator of sigma E activity
LIAESELNRAQLVQELQAISGEVHALANQAQTITAFASAAVKLMVGLVSFRRKKKSSPVAEKPSWLKTILQGAQLAGSLWSEFRAPKK